ncbi:MAG: glycoside hydrolase family 97 catalytic domain-containing protein [Oscillospiraceae bacterium]|nr:glycoside hydrolase family 97 catalytic domain-containing protein [Oscillospiraceae bacterium]
MLKRNCTKKLICLAVSAGFIWQLSLNPLPSLQKQTALAVTDYTNAVVANQGSSDQMAIIRGEQAEVVYDSTCKSNVLDLSGGSFGAGWLQLPSVFQNGCQNGFTFSMRYQLDAQAEGYTRLFQFSTVPFGTGAAPGYSAPDISVDLNDKTSLRASVFAGSAYTTADDDRHRALYTLDTKPDTAWHQLTVVYQPDGAAYYLDGSLLTINDGDTLTDTMQSLFADQVLPYYLYGSIGHSVYSDHDLNAKIDDVAFYDYALTAEQAKSLPADAAYLYTFETDTVSDGASVGASQTAVTADGANVTSIPSLQSASPDGTLISKIWKDNSGKYYYSVHKRNGGSEDTIVEPSRLGFVTTTEDLSTGFSQNTPAFSYVTQDEQYSMPFGKHLDIRNHYNEIAFPLVKGESILTVIIRVYDDGFGVRYALNHGATIKEESTQVVFPQKSTFWGNWPNATYEWDMVELPMDKIIGAWADYSCPFTGFVDNRYWVLLSEANVFNEDNPYCAGCVKTAGGSRILTWKFGVKTETVNMSGAFHTPWRALIVGDTLDEMASSELILNLNPPSVLEDISWVKPGKVAWSWWSSGGDSPIEYHTQKDYIDFAAANGWDYVCLDFGWALWDDSAAKVKELCDYGAERGIGIYLWYGVNNKGHSGYKDSAGNPAYPYYSLLDEATIVREFERIHSLGVQGVKVDYYESDTQETMKQMNLCMKIAADNQLMVLFHGCTVPRGESRTYPNVVSYEAINGSEYYKWFESPSLANRVSYPFTRNVIGSADFTPTGVPIYGIKATAGFALADVVTIESGVQHFAHSVYTYEGSSALPLLNDVPVVWDELKILDGYPMQFNVTARRSSNDWYIGAATIAARSISIELSDLITDDATYNAYLFCDNADGSDLEVTVLSGLTKDSVIERNLLANGGCVIKLTKGTMKLDTPYTNYLSYEAEHAVLSGQAAVSSGKDGKYSSNNAYVGYVGGNGNNHVTFTNVTAPADGEYTLRIYYVSGEPRSLKVDVNGAFVKKLDNLYANRNDWTGIRAVNLTVTLKAGQNTIKLYNDTAYGPSIDRIALAIPADTNCLGDMNGDQQIDGRDLSMLKIGIMNGFTNAQAKRSADFNQDGTIDVKDAVSMAHFLTANT